MITRKLYVEFRVHVDPTTNQDLLKEMADRFQEFIYDEWNNTATENDEESIKTTDVTYEIVAEIKEGN